MELFFVTDKEQAAKIYQQIDANKDVAQKQAYSRSYCRALFTR